MAEAILTQHVLRMLPSEEIGFAKPAVTYRRADGSEHTIRAWKFSAPEPELARAKNDPGYWTITVFLPLDATPVSLVPDPDGPGF